MTRQSRKTSAILAVTLFAMSATSIVLLAWRVASAISTIDDVHQQMDVVSVGRNAADEHGETGVIGRWPPREGTFYPDLVLADQHGKTVRLSDFAGKVILIELAAVPCAGCQAFAGGNERGGFGGAPVQKNLESIHRYAERFAGVTLGDNPDVVFVQLLLYGKSMGSPTQQEVSAWAKHFGMNRRDNEIVLRGDPSILGRETYEMIPGFHLIDRNFMLRYDSSGHHSKCDLFGDLLPALGQMCGRGK